MAGIYIHIPFCKKACHYCDFHFSTSTDGKEAMVKAILQEAIIQRDYVSEEISTIYLGGGTPSLLSEEELQEILSGLRQYFSVAPSAEITLEANPDDITFSKAGEWKQQGINRLSIGIQSFFEEDLRWMNRAHTASQAKECILLAQQVGFDNISIDLIYGTPVLTDTAWEKNIETALALNIPHLSCYALTVEPKTALAKLIEKHVVDDVDTEKQARHFSLLRQWLSDAGFEQYEISNFAKPGFRSRHNSSYWQGKHYLGLGPSAHSFNGESRQWNVRNNAQYIKNIEQGKIPFELEELTTVQQFNEYIMISLRTIEGISVSRVNVQWGKQAAESLLANAEKHFQQGNLLLSEEHIRLSESGKFLADGLAADLFSVS